MTRHSLRLRLALAGAASVALALVVAFLGLSLLFERHVERRIVEELRLHLDQVFAGLDRDPAGRLDVMRPPADPRFQRPLSGLYWAIEHDGTRRQSRSLWDQTLVLPALAPGEPKQSLVQGPADTRLLMLARRIVTGPNLGARSVLAAVAIDRQEIERATADFRRDLAPLLAILAGLLCLASFAQIVVGLRPLKLLRDRIAAIRSGDAKRLGSGFPDEVLPLTAEVDGLLASREEQLEKARARAADLAHGFKTPLQALTGDVLQLREAGMTRAADDIEGVIIGMRRLVDQEMVRARMAGRDVTARASLADVADRVIAVLSRTPHGDAIDWHNGLTAADCVRLDAGDLAELLGTILENAARYAQESVTLRAERTGDRIRLSIRDDGPGIPDDKLSHVLRRGERLDTNSTGAGLGFSIAQNIVEAADGSIVLRNAAPGLEVVVDLPAADERLAQ
ncbi:HAMP domain-containing histidine kinase [Rhizobium sp. DKSPLA3]|uniref:histidine kinase n=1 Tax=Rhizobium quercicola TaxID=2901226 RepID=A0A9X1NNN8_9HYPH|nr:HAMP domain-containing sensor histidine kinase [Rhizobium quercicola]MCD7107940.1 HAMP domain-containing histidine kinase [Rhizobium quercicola]